MPAGLINQNYEFKQTRNEVIDYLLKAKEKRKVAITKKLVAAGHVAGRHQASALDLSSSAAHAAAMRRSAKRWRWPMSDRAYLEVSRI